uniref:Transcription factor bHLH8 n=1 Tax=Nothapodytes nimmoniana TaxID=159386 RepID=A0A9E8Z1M4_NOTNI|nr:transcription factor bHLH8 [Nothapodytes nimmoniana]
MEFSNSFDRFAKNYGFHGIVRGGSSSSSSLILDSEKGELVKTLVRPGQKAVNEEKALLALRNHSEAERRRRERINCHLATLRSLIPGTDKMDKAALLAEVISGLKELRRNAAEATKGILVPMDIDEVRVEEHADGTDGSCYSIRASLCCDYKHEILSDLRQALEALNLNTVSTEIATLGSRMLNVFVITGSKEGNIKDTEGTQVLVSTVCQALRSVLDRFYASQEFSARNSLFNKRRRVSLLNSSSSSSVGDFW